MIDNISERRRSERMPTEILGKIEEENCHIDNLSDGGAFLLSTFKGKVGQEVTIRFTYNRNFFEKKGIIRAANSVSTVRSSIYKNNHMYTLSVAFIESVSQDDFFSLDD